MMPLPYLPTRRTARSSWLGWAGRAWETRTQAPGLGSVSPGAQAGTRHGGFPNSSSSTFAGEEEAQSYNTYNALRTVCILPLSIMLPLYFFSLALGTPQPAVSLRSS